MQVIWEVSKNVTNLAQQDNSPDRLRQMSRLMTEMLSASSYKEMFGAVAWHFP